MGVYLSTDVKRAYFAEEPVAEEQRPVRRRPTALKFLAHWIASTMASPDCYRSFPKVVKLSSPPAHTDVRRGRNPKVIAASRSSRRLDASGALRSSFAFRSVPM